MSYAQDTGKFDSSLQATKPETIKNWVPRRNELLGNKFLGGRSKEHNHFLLTYSLILRIIICSYLKGLSLEW